MLFQEAKWVLFECIMTVHDLMTVENVANSNIAKQYTSSSNY